MYSARVVLEVSPSSVSALLADVFSCSASATKVLSDRRVSGRVLVEQGCFSHHHYKEGDVFREWLVGISQNI